MPKNYTLSAINDAIEALNEFSVQEAESIDRSEERKYSRLKIINRGVKKALMEAKVRHRQKFFSLSLVVGRIKSIYYLILERKRNIKSTSGSVCYLTEWYFGVTKEDYISPVTEFLLSILVLVSETLTLILSNRKETDTTDRKFKEKINDIVKILKTNSSMIEKLNRIKNDSEGFEFYHADSEELNTPETFEQRREYCTDFKNKVVDHFEDFLITFRKYAVAAKKIVEGYGRELENTAKVKTIEVEGPITTSRFGLFPKKTKIQKTVSTNRRLRYVLIAVLRIVALLLAASKQIGKAPDILDVIQTDDFKIDNWVNSSTDLHRVIPEGEDPEKTKKKHLEFLIDALFPAGRPLPSDVAQGQIGDCWLLAAFQSLADTNPDAIMACFLNLYSKSGHTKVHFRLGEEIKLRLYEINFNPITFSTEPGRPRIIKVSLARTYSGNRRWALWPQVLEKGMAALFGASGTVHGGSCGIPVTVANSQPWSLREGSDTALQTMTPDGFRDPIGPNEWIGPGGKGEIHNIEAKYSIYAFTAITGKKAKLQTVSAIFKNSLSNTIKTFTQKSKPITCSFLKNIEVTSYDVNGNELPKKIKLHGPHAYEVAEIFEIGDKKYVTVRNPWGGQRFGESGNIILSFDDFMKYSHSIDVIDEDETVSPDETVQTEVTLIRSDKRKDVKKIDLKKGTRIPALEKKINEIFGLPISTALIFAEYDEGLLKIAKTDEQKQKIRQKGRKTFIQRSGMYNGGKRLEVIEDYIMLRAENASGRVRFPFVRTSHLCDCYEYAANKLNLPSRDFSSFSAVSAPEGHEVQILETAGHEFLSPGTNPTLGEIFSEYEDFSKTLIISMGLQPQDAKLKISAAESGQEKIPVSFRLLNREISCDITKTLEVKKGTQFQELKKKVSKLFELNETGGISFCKNDYVEFNSWETITEKIAKKPIIVITEYGVYPKSSIKKIYFKLKERTIFLEFNPYELIPLYRYEMRLEIMKKLGLEGSDLSYDFFDQENTPLSQIDFKSLITEEKIITLTCVRRVHVGFDRRYAEFPLDSEVYLAEDLPNDEIIRTYLKNIYLNSLSLEGIKAYYVDGEREIPIEECGKGYDVKYSKIKLIYRSNILNEINFDYSYVKKMKFEVNANPKKIYDAFQEFKAQAFKGFDELPKIHWRVGFIFNLEDGDLAGIGERILGNPRFNAKSLNVSLEATDFPVKVRMMKFGTHEMESEKRLIFPMNMPYEKMLELVQFSFNTNNMLTLKSDSSSQMNAVLEVYSGQPVILAIPNFVSLRIRGRMEIPLKKSLTIKECYRIALSKIGAKPGVDFSGISCRALVSKGNSERAYEVEDLESGKSKNVSEIFKSYLKYENVKIIEINLDKNKIKIARNQRLSNGKFTIHFKFEDKTRKLEVLEGETLGDIREDILKLFDLSGERFEFFSDQHCLEFQKYGEDVALNEEISNEKTPIYIGVLRYEKLQFRFFYKNIPHKIEFPVGGNLNTFKNEIIDLIYSETADSPPIFLGTLKNAEFYWRDGENKIPVEGEEVSGRYTDLEIITKTEETKEAAAKNINFRISLFGLDPESVKISSLENKGEFLSWLETYKTRIRQKHKLPDWVKLTINIWSLKLYDIDDENIDDEVIMEKLLSSESEDVEAEMQIKFKLTKAHPEDLVNNPDYNEFALSNNEILNMNISKFKKDYIDDHFFKHCSSSNIKITKSEGAETLPSDKRLFDLEGPPCVEVKFTLVFWDERKETFSLLKHKDIISEIKQTADAILVPLWFESKQSDWYNQYYGAPTRKYFIGNTPIDQINPESLVNQGSEEIEVKMLSCMHGPICEETEDLQFLSIDPKEKVSSLIEEGLVCIDADSKVVSPQEILWNLESVPGIYRIGKEVILDEKKESVEEWLI